MADEQVKDISAISESPMEIDIYVLSYKGNGKPEDRLIDKVYNKLNSEDTRPMGDKITVHKADIVEFKLQVEITFKISNVVDKASILQNIKANLEDYVKEEHKIGGIISKAGIYARVYLDYVVDVIIKEPQDNIKCNLKQAPYCVEIIVEELQQ